MKSTSLCQEFWNLIIALDHVTEEYRDNLQFVFCARRAVRAAIDTVGTHAYGLTRDRYAYILSTFSHVSYVAAPHQCLAAFTKQHDPYWNIPLNENLSQPVIDLPIPEPAPDAAPAKSHKELFDFQTTPGPVGSGALFTEQPVARKRKKGGKS